MRIAINLLYLIPEQVGGTEIYASGLLHGLAQIETQDEFFIFVNQECADWSLPKRSNFRQILCPVRASNRANRYYFEQMQLPTYLKQYSIDVVHSLGYVGPLRPPCLSIITIPDTNFVALRDTIPVQKRLVNRLFTTLSAKRADRILTISKFSRGEIVRNLGIPGEKIFVTYLGPRFGDGEQSQQHWEDLQRQFNIFSPYIIAFGGGALHKNLQLLLRAFLRINDKFDHMLVIVGHVPDQIIDFIDALEPKTRERIALTGYVAYHQIRPLLSHADLFILPSRYEGFGLPLIEAQQAGVPVLSSKAASLPEIGGDGADYFDPSSEPELVCLLEKYLKHPEQRKILISRGKENLKRFSWEKTASETLAIYKL